MSSITVVTTFHQPGLSLYGQRFIDSFAENVESKVKLVVYAENCSPKNPNPDQITILDAIKELPKLNAFKERWKDVPHANGDITNHSARHGRKDWNKGFKWDAIRFANKVYAVFDACEKHNDWVVWMDADTFIHSPWKHKEFNNLLPQHDYITYVGRGKGSQTWPECGFYGIILITLCVTSSLKSLNACTKMPTMVCLNYLSGMTVISLVKYLTSIKSFLVMTIVPQCICAKQSRAVADIR
tara:strand:- start:814 stop:1536 length:723 start_codon:yes stop_codon:yes gene_type:complete